MTNAQTNGNGIPADLKSKLWTAADKLRGHMDAAEYKHVVLGLIFLKKAMITIERDKQCSRAYYRKIMGAPTLTSSGSANRST